MRVFIAIDLPQEVKKELLNIQRQLPKAKLRVVKDFHLTLKFIGEITPERVEKAKELLEKVEFKASKVSLSNIGVFPSENYIRVVWVGLEPEKELFELQQKIEAVLQKEFRNDKGFKAHLTLARVKFVDDKKGFVEELKNIKVERKEFLVDSFKLKKSTLTNEGPIYDDLAIFRPKSL